MNRRRFLGLTTGAVAGLAGCSTRRDAPADTPRPPEAVTTSSAEAIEILVAQLVIGSTADGPDAYYRFRNTGGTDATIKVRTELVIENGGTYSAFGIITVPAGAEVTLRYRIVRFETLSPAERDRVRNVEGIDYRVFVNGEERADV